MVIDIRLIDTKATENGTDYTMFVVVDLPEMIKERETHKWFSNVIVSVSKRLRCSVRIDTKTFWMPVLRLRNTDLAGVKLSDWPVTRKRKAQAGADSEPMFIGNSWTAAVCELGFLWLRNHLKQPLTICNPERWAGDQTKDTCLNCRWCRMVRMGSDEMDLDFKDDDGMSRRDFGDIVPGAFQPIYQCLLFTTWLEVEFGLIEEFNVMSEGGMVNDQLINIRAGWGQEKWHNIEWVRTQMMRTKACLFHRQRNFSYGFQSSGNTTLDGGGRSLNEYEDSDWYDKVPVGWMPKTGRGIIVIGGIELWDESIPRSVIDEDYYHDPKEVRSNVFKGMPVGQGEHTVWQPGVSASKSEALSTLAASADTGGTP